jgi:outer membrane protein assembly factor BamB
MSILPEYVTTPPLLRAGILYVSTFIPRVKTADEEEACPDAGYSKIYALDPLTGAGRWKDLGGGSQAVLIGNIKITGITIQGNRMYVGAKPLSASGLKNLPLQVSEKKYLLPDETLWSFELPGKEVEALPTIDPNTPYIQYWRDIVKP